MPKLSNKTLDRRARGANLHTFNAPDRFVNPYGYYAVHPYPNTGIRLILDFDNTLVSAYNKSQPIPPIPDHLRDFIYFCLKSCETVTIYTARDHDDAIYTIKEVIGPLFERVKVLSRRDMATKEYEGRKYEFKIIKYIDFHIEKTLIIDDNPIFYTHLEPTNLLIVKHNNDFEGFYEEIIKFLKGFSRIKTLNSQLKALTDNSMYLTLYTDEPEWGFSAENEKKRRKRISKI